jgi:hypothetical protein
MVLMRVVHMVEVAFWMDTVERHCTSGTRMNLERSGCEVVPEVINDILNKEHWHDIILNTY